MFAKNSYGYNIFFMCCNNVAEFLLNTSLKMEEYSLCCIKTTLENVGIIAALEFGSRAVAQVTGNPILFHTIHRFTQKIAEIGGVDFMVNLVAFSIICLGLSVVSKIVLSLYLGREISWESWGYPPAIRNNAGHSDSEIVTTSA